MIVIIEGGRGATVDVFKVMVIRESGVGGSGEEGEKRGIFPRMIEDHENLNLWAS